MPMAKIIKNIKTAPNEFTQIAHHCILLKDGDRWCVIDPETNNELIIGATARFLRKEIEKGRLFIDAGWDFQVKD